MNNIINGNKNRIRYQNKRVLKRDENGNYTIYPKDIEKRKNKNKTHYRIKQMYKQRIRNKIIILMVSAFSLLLILGYFNKNRYVRFLENNPYSQGEKIKISDMQRQLPNLENRLGIHDVEYKWDEELEYKNKPKVLVFHHAASKELTPQQINDMHKKKEWAGIGYHFYIRKDGTIYRGRPENAIGAHIKGQNKDTLGICLEGNLEEEEPTEEEIKALEDLSTYLIVKYNINRVQGHGDTYDTLCPGKNFAIENVKEGITTEIETIKR